LTLAALDAAGAAGCRSVTLNATAEGRPMYQRAGFELLA
jgi:hypothetical protein